MNKFHTNCFCLRPQANIFVGIEHPRLLWRGGLTANQFAYTKAQCRCVGLGCGKDHYLVPHVLLLIMNTKLLVTELTTCMCEIVLLVKGVKACLRPGQIFWRKGKTGSDELTEPCFLLHIIMMWNIWIFEFCFLYKEEYLNWYLLYINVFFRYWIRLKKIIQFE